MLPLACFSGTWTGSYSVAPGWVQNTQHDSTYVSFFEQRSTLTTDLTTPISVASTASSLSTAYPETDAYGILVAPKQTFGITDSNSGSTWPGPLTLPWPKGAPNGGDLEIACVENQAHVVPNTPPGWTAAYTSAGDLFGTGLFYKYASVGEPASVSFTLPVQGNISAAIVHVEGNDVHLGFRGFTHTGFGAVTNVAAQVPVDPNHGGMLALACFSGVWTTSYSGAPG
ncbi:MAG: hypothetical protein GIW95_10630, partial [Candidatus Eremiobacteraeota bacterium]|nr:hypothetical protein [Candidatus Eremiobacteraeota bacterium]